jgi:hypothetical protein
MKGKARERSNLWLDPAVAFRCTPILCFTGLPLKALDDRKKRNGTGHGCTCDAKVIAEEWEGKEGKKGKKRGERRQDRSTRRGREGRSKT